MVDSVEFGTYVRPKKGWPVAGDAALARLRDGKLVGAIVDVLGHGTEAHELAARIETLVLSLRATDPMALMNELRGHLQGSVGAAVGVFELDVDSGGLDYVGIGNTVLRKFGGREARLVSTPGVVGGIARRPRLYRAQVERGDVILLYTDGVRDHFRLSEYPQLLTHDAVTVARTVVERFGKRHDDSGCLAIRF